MKSTSSPRTQHAVAIRRSILGAVLALCAVAAALVGIAPITTASASGEASNLNAVATDSDGDGDLDRPDQESAVAAAVTAGEPVEDLSKRTESSRTIANPDGTWTDEMFATEARVEDAEGEWHDVSYDLTRNADGSFSPEMSANDVRISGGGTSEAARVTLDDGESMAISWPTTLPAPVVSGGVATYKISASTDFIVSMTGSGVSTKIRLNSEPAADDPVFTLGLRTDDLEVEQLASGGLKMTNDEGQQVGATTQLMAWDAVMDDGNDPQNVVPVTAELDEVSSTGDITKHSLSLEVPDGFLSDPATTYPVTIDPDIGDIHAAADTWTRYGTTTPNGGSYRLQVGRISDSPNNYQTLSYMQWPMTPMLNFPEESKVVIRANMRLFAYFAGSCDPRAMIITPLVAPFNEASTVYTNAPNIRTGAMVGATDTSVVWENYGKNGCPAGDNEGNNDWVDADITKVVSAWADGKYPADGFRMNVSAAGASDLSYERRFCSRNLDASDDVCKYWSMTPRLYVTYETRPYTPSSPRVVNPDATPAAGDEELGCDVSLGNISTPPKVRVDVNDPEQDSVTPTFQWSAGSTVPDTAPTVDGSPVSTGSGLSPATRELPIPAGASGQFSFRVKARDALGSSKYSDVCTFTIDRTRPGNPTMSPMPSLVASGSSHNIVFTPGGDDPSKTKGYALTLNTANPPSAPQFAASGTLPYTHSFLVTGTSGQTKELRLWAFSTAPGTSGGTRSELSDYQTFEIS